MGDRINKSGALAGISIDYEGNYCFNGYSSNNPVVNKDMFLDIIGPAGELAGISCGTPASRPTTCTTGQGYWATTQSCSNLTGMVGVNPSMPISGTLYKCTAPNTWTTFYTPYTYPHPLRTDCPNYPTLCDASNDMTPPAAPTGLTVQ